MFGLGEPTPTHLDLRFTLFQFPVRVHPFFWIVGLVMSSSTNSPQLAMIWVAALFVSILIHELGHAFAFRYFGTESHVVLYGFGGLCVPGGSSGTYSRWDYQRWNDSPQSQIVIAAAGPAAGFLFAAVILALCYVAAATQGMSYPVVPNIGWPYLIDWDVAGDFGNWIGYYPYFFLLDLLFINIFWGLVNLLPILPLDGGQISKQILILSDRPDPIRAAHQLSVFVAVLMAIWGMYLRSPYMAVMFAMLAYQNYMAQHSPYGDQRPW